MNGRKISFTYGGITLNISGYCVTAEDKLTEIALINGNIRTVNVGKAATYIKVSGKLPSFECQQLLNTARPLVAKTDDLTVDGVLFLRAMLDSVIIEPDTAEGFAKYTMRFHV